MNFEPTTAGITGMSQATYSLAIRDFGVMQMAIRDFGVMQMAIRDFGVMRMAIRDFGVMTPIPTLGKAA